MSDAQEKKSGPGGSWRTRLRSRLRRPLSFYLTMLLLVAIVPSFVFSLIILKRSTDEQERVVTALLKASTGSVTRLVEREVDGMLTTLKVLVAAGADDGNNPERFYGRARSSLADTDSNLLVIDRGHNQLFNTRVPYGSPLGKASDPISIDQAFRNGGPFISNVFFGKTAQKWVFNVYLPITTPLGNSDYLLALTRNAESMAKTVNRDVLSPGWNAALLDGAGHVIASSDPDLAVGKPFFMEIVPALRVGVGDAVHDGVEYRTVTEFFRAHRLEDRRLGQKCRGRCASTLVLSLAVAGWTSFRRHCRCRIHCHCQPADAGRQGSRPVTLIFWAPAGRSHRVSI